MRVIEGIGNRFRKFVLGKPEPIGLLDRTSPLTRDGTGRLVCTLFASWRIGRRLEHLVDLQIRVLLVPMISEDEGFASIARHHLTIRGNLLLFNHGRSLSIAALLVNGRPCQC
jgi:hypothetical protein